MGYPQGSGSGGTPLGYTAVGTGNKVALFIETGDPTVSSVLITGGAVTTPVYKGRLATAGHDLEVWECDITTGGQFTPQVTTSAGSGWWAYAVETSGATAFTFASASGTSAAPSLGQNALSGSLVIAAVHAAVAVTGAPATWTDLNGAGPAVWSWATGSDGAYKTSGGGTVTETWALGSSAAWEVVSIVASAAPPGTVTPIPATGVGTASNVRGPSTFNFKFGLNGTNEIQWDAPASYPSTIAALTAIGATISRQVLWGNNLNPAVVQPYYNACKAANIQLVLTIAPLGPNASGVWNAYPEVLPSGSAFATSIASIAAACPGIWWELGNECDQGSPNNAANYMPLYNRVVAAIKAADPTALVGPCPVANINIGGSGINWLQTLVTNGLATATMDFLPIHDYPIPNNIEGNVPWAGGLSAETMIPVALAQFTTWGLNPPKGVWLTEWGWQWQDSSTPPSVMTLALQATYCVQFMQYLNGAGLPVVIAYSMADEGQYYGWMNVTNQGAAGQTYTPRPVYTAVQNLIGALAQTVTPVPASAAASAATPTVLTGTLNSVTAYPVAAHATGTAVQPTRAGPGITVHPVSASATARAANPAAPSLKPKPPIPPPWWGPPVSPRWGAAIVAPVLQIVSIGQVYSGINGSLLATLTNITNGSVKVDQTNAVRRSCSEVVVTIDPRVDSGLVPASNFGVLFPSGAELVLQKGIVYSDGSREFSQQGVFLIETPNVSRGVGGSGTVQIDIAGSDRSVTVSRAEFTAPYSTDGTSSADQQIRRIINMQVPALTAFNFQHSRVVPPIATYAVGDDPWAACQALAAAASMELYFDRFGFCVLQPVPDPQSAPIAASYKADLSSIITQNTRGLTNVGVPNVIIGIAQGSGVAVPLQAMWFDSDPSSRTYYGPAGPPAKPQGTYPTTTVTLTFSSITVQSDLQNAVNAAGRAQKGRFETCDTFIRDDPSRDVWDVVWLEDDTLGMAAPFVIDCLTVQLGYSAPMEIVGRRVYQ